MVKATDLGGGGTWQWQEFTSSGTFYVPSGVHTLYVSGVGGGGGASGSPTNYITSTYSFGGGAGGAVIRHVLNIAPGNSIPVQIGSGGIGHAAANQGSNSGSPGGNTIIGSITLDGGGGGTASTSNGSGKGGFNGSSAGSNGATVIPDFISGAWGKGSCGLHISNSVRGGGASIYGNGGASGNSSSVNGLSAGANTGAGGGPGYADGSNIYSGTGGNGGSGYVLIEWVK